MSTQRQTNLRVKTVPIHAEIASLAWMSGLWQSEQDTTWTEEFWSIPKDMVMLGTARLHNQTGLVHTDLTWFIEDERKVHSQFRRFDKKFRPFSHLIEPIRFDLVEIRDNYAVFYCSEPDSNAWMVYERKGSSLHGTFYFGDDLNVMYAYRLVLKSMVLS
jgi:hypothetical protein